MQQTITTNPSTSTEKTMLGLIADLVGLIKKQGLAAADGAEGKRLLEALAARQGLTEKQMLVIALMTNFAITGGTTMKEIAAFCKCDNMRLVALLPEINQLIAEGYLTERDRFNGITLNTDAALMRAYAADQPFVPKDYRCADNDAVLFEYDALTSQLFSDKIRYEVFLHRMGRLIESNRHLPLIQALERAGLTEDGDKALLLYLCSERVVSSEAKVDLGSSARELLSSEEFAQNCFANRLRKGCGPLFEKKLIEHASADGLRDTSAVCLTRKGLKTLLGTAKTAADASSTSTVSLVAHKGIVEKRLYFDSYVEEQVKRLADLLGDAPFRDVQRRLKARGMRTGFTCLFYGTPGTGKTETALQLARRTGRDIMQVNISEIRSMWVGESEKNIQALFDDYRQRAKAARRCPILLFNEADAIFGQRGRGARRSADKMENALQNIILQEMEKLEGILIATTNLQGNLDPAFERRFLYKVQFVRPSLEARSHIWRAHIPTLTVAAARSLAERYSLSGGQIENVTRKHLVDEVLYGTPTDLLARLRSYCEDEQLEKNARRRIGFAAV